ncbi:4-aminobutyrate aminotransferase-like enzyme [Caldalkalibacillus uzonensis]|uniref:4-aminobutyrate aminotransferase-like enzyme n=1 Tax=Caldalkalibacillus uzonensis TaxID=353224 RepID=A0ABU0CSI8_9BACI|nr:hypothetical protein [Caldalkalibacillus uzonensis]MDQ0337997.1 4-aminobutyrate aminotransferase-like enzyme [Caldalkalibacillus uzonensis]
MNRYTQIINPIPGPKAKELLDKRNRYVARGVSNSAVTFAAQAEGDLITDVDGNRFINFAKFIKKCP